MTRMTYGETREALSRIAQLALNFVRERTRESCTRLCAVMCCVTGCSAAVATVCFAFRHPVQAATVGALVGITSALIAAGCVALLTRTPSTGVPPESPTSPTPPASNASSASNPSTPSNTSNTSNIPKGGFSWSRPT